MTEKRFTVTREVEIDYGHRVPHDKSKCKNIHGHRGKIEVDVEGPLVLEGHRDPIEGMVMNFSDIKLALDEHVVKTFDHILIICASDDACKKTLMHGLNTSSLGNNQLGARYFVDGVGWVQETPGVPTAENLAFYCYQMLAQVLDRGSVYVTEVRFHETAKCVAKYSVKDQNREQASFAGA